MKKHFPTLARSIQTRQLLRRFLGVSHVSIGLTGVIAIPSERVGAQIVTKNVREALALIDAVSR